ncbi:hypothetical protein TNCT_482671 [Trichonephila clavata]|uniref:Uncharacterized protein n=1 Tax=Trichonephila clavata TaxID=2740835 RepID=A0A8X6HP82_TRICU|nr:hypothetical protein TNCT_482671 [Trichonephila clavata]
MPYIITMSVDVVNGLSNGSYGHLKLVEKYEAIPPEENANIGDDKRLWLKFTGSSRIDQIMRKLTAKFMQVKNNQKLGPHWLTQCLHLSQQ